MGERLDHLDEHEKNILLDFFFYRLSMDMRGELMGRYPTLYAKVYPTVDPERIIRAVRAIIGK